MTLRAVKFYLKNPVAIFKRLGNMVHEWRHPDEPWLEPRAVRFLEPLLKKDMTLFEWGSGRSTLWFSKRVHKVVSIEYNKEWYEKVKVMLAEENITNVELRYVPLQHSLQDPTPKHYDPVPKYVEVIHEFPEGNFDVIVIDGHYRLTCADHCMGHLKAQGYLIIDNSNRVSKEEWGVPSHWPLLHETENVMTQTSIWRKELQ